MLEAKTMQLPDSWKPMGDRYEYGFDEAVKTGWIRATEEVDDSGSLNKRLSAEPFLGRRIRLTGLCRTTDVSERAGLYVRAERQNGRYMAHDSMWDRNPVGTTDWQRYELVIDVPPDAGWIWIGAHLRGKGQVWFKDLEIDVVSIDIPTTDQYAFGCVGKWDSEPINLDFTQNELPELRQGRESYISEARRWVISTDDEETPYEFVRSRDVLYQGKPAGHVRPAARPGIGYLYQHFAAPRFRNKRIRYSAHIKTKDVEKGAWLRVYIFDFDGNDLLSKYSARGVSGNEDWTKLEIEFEVPREAYVIDIGADIFGAGEMYLGGLEFEVLGDASTEWSELLPGITLLTPEKDGWLLERADHITDLPDLPGSGVKLRAVKPGPQMKASLGARLSSVPVNRELTFSCMLRGSRCGQKVKVYLHAFDSNYNLIRNSILHVTLEHSTWTPFKSTFVLPSETVHFHVWVVSFATHAAYVAQPSLLLGNSCEKPPEYNTDYREPPEPAATKVVEAHYKATARAINDGDEGTVTFPIPGPYRGQVPLNFSVQTKPKSALLGCKIKRRDDGINWVAEVRVKPPEKGVVISWDSLVLIRGEEEVALPAASIEVPPHTVPWLRSTKCVQSDDEEIKQKAAELAKTSTDLESYVRSVIHFTSHNRGKKGKKFDSLDAKTAIGAGGSCTSRANLAAALLRANGIPARTVSHLPSWFNSYFFEHWLVEYWHPGIGWVWVEPTMNRMQPDANELIVLAVSSADDEDKCDDPVHLRYLMPGGAYLSGCELSRELVSAAIIKKVNAPNIAIEQAEIRGSKGELADLFQIAMHNFERLSAHSEYEDQSAERNDAIRAAVLEGDAGKLAERLRCTEVKSSKRKR